jgi:putative transposase
MWKLAERGILVRDRSALGKSFRSHDRSRFAQAPPQAIPHLASGDKAYLKIAGRMVYFPRAVDAEGEVLDVLAQPKRDKHAALKLMRKLLKKYGFVSGRMITDDLRSCSAAARDLGIESRHERGQWRNNRGQRVSV